MAETDDVEVHIINGKGDYTATPEEDEESSSRNKTKKKDKKSDELNPVGVFEFFRFADCLDILLLFIAILAAIAMGLAMPGLMIFLGDSFDVFSNHNYLAGKIVQLFEAENITVPSGLNFTQLQGLAVVNNISLDSLKLEFLPIMKRQAIILCITAAVILVCGYIQVTLFVTTAARQTNRIRNKCFAAIMRQNIGWFDSQKSGDLNNRLTNDINKIFDGMGDKFGQFFSWTSTTISGFLYSLIVGWKLTLSLIAISPLMMIGGYLMTKVASSFTQKEMRSYAKAGSIANEVLGSIRTVTAFSGEKKETDRYTANLYEARTFGIKKGLSTGVSLGFYWFSIAVVNALGFWYGSKLTRDEPENYSSGKVLTLFFCVSFSAIAMGQAAPSLQTNAEGRGAARKIYDLIDQESKINYENDDGDELQNVEGDITFQDVKFSYPQRDQITALDVKEMTIPAGKTVALVGSSGSGKSTTVGLIQRFYDPDSGSIKLDGVDIKNLRLGWYRSLIGIVSQEPVLFACSIKENIRYGHDGVSDSEIEEAAKMANAHDFIHDLPDGYDTLVGDRGAQLSGGQKQRIAIARALVRNPKILLLDEATSALDTESEGLVQAALERAEIGRTTLVIAHRLSTVRNSDLIIGIEDGLMKEIGTHDELMEKDGIYANLVANQTREEDNEMKITTVKEEYSVDLYEDDELELALARKRYTPRNSVDSDHFKHTRGLFRRRETTATIDEAVELLVDEGDEKVVEEEIKNTKAGFFPLLKLNGKEWYWMFFGSLNAFINGGMQPISGLITADVLSVMGEIDHKVQKEKTLIFTMIFLGLGIVSFICQLLQSYMFSRSGEELTLRVRSLMFRTYLRQEISFFDWPSNTLGALTARLTTDASLIQNGTGVRLGIIMCSISGIGLGSFIAFFCCWKLALVIIAFVPLMVLGGFMEVAAMKGHGNKGENASEGFAKVSVESIENIRTVVGLQLEKKFVNEYRKNLLVSHKATLRNSHLHGFGYGLSQGFMYVLMGTAFYYGAVLVSNHETDFIQVMRALMALLFGAMAVGNASALAPDAGKAAIASQYLFWLLGRKSTIDSSSDEGSELKAPEGQVSLRGVRFRYPTRLESAVLHGIDINIEPGERVAIVGSSGCGKSTIMQLLERFYDPLQGEIFIDDIPIMDLRISSLRYTMSLVSQEPVLFDRTIAENISYGNNANPPSMQEIIEAAKKANIHSFIESIPDGYDTMVGEKGTQLSGGQKQRIAIARAIVRNPKILLLDEATSALDAESEKVVQEALDNVQVGRTCIVVAHRLSTVRDADRIVVIHQGRIKEVGKHADLMSKQGIYYRLVNNQATAGLIS